MWDIAAGEIDEGGVYRFAASKCHLCNNWMWGVQAIWTAVSPDMTVEEGPFRKGKRRRIGFQWTRQVS